MAANKRKQDEKHLKMLREMVALPHNKTCFDCHQRGPTYVNMAIGSFVCTSCSGLLRGLNPPHRVKSISMTSFTPEEMEFLRCRGNELCRQVWLGLYDNRSYSEPDSKDENKIKDFMCQKYEKKRWYVAPTDSMHQEAKRRNTPVKQPETKTLKSLVGNNIPSLVIQNNAQSSPKAPAAAPAVPSSQPAQPPAAVAAPHPPAPTAQQPPAQKPSSGFDLLGDLGGDPFAKPQPQAAAPPGGGFADFSAFSSHHPPPQQQTHSFAPPPAASSVGLLQPMSSSGISSFPPAASSTATAPSAADKYAALASLDDAFSSEKTVNWDGSGGGFSSAPSGGGFSTASSGGHISWGGGGVSSAPNVSSGLFGAPSTINSSVAANPFGSGPSSSVVPSASSSMSVANPFMHNSAGGSTQLATAGGFGGPPQHPPPNYQQVAAMSAASNNNFAAFGQFPPVSSGFGGAPSMQNGGGFAQQWPAQSHAATSVSSSMQMNAFGPPPNQNMFAKQPGFGAVPQHPQQHQQAFGAWGTLPQAPNPFMNATQHQQVAPPRSNSTNPFL